jgi:hypothetical protein
MGSDAGWPPSEAMEILQILDQINQGLSALSSWLESFWPYLLLLPLLMWALVAVPGRLRSLWVQTLEHPLSGLWPVPAAILPAFIPFARDWDKLAQTGTKRYSVGWLLLAIAVIQIYGQLCSQRYRKAAEDASDRIGTRVEAILAAFEGRPEGNSDLQKGNQGISKIGEPSNEKDGNTILRISDRNEELSETNTPAASSLTIEEDEDLLGWQFIEPPEIKQFYNDWLAFEFRKCDSSTECFSAILDQINYIGKPFFLEALRISSWQASQYAYQFGALEGSDYLIETGISQAWISNWIDSLLCDENAERMLPEGSERFGVVKDCLEFGVYQGAFHGLMLRKGLKGTARDGYPFRIPGRGGVGRI